jgi:hypothetical protein
MLAGAFARTQQIHFQTVDEHIGFRGDFYELIITAFAGHCLDDAAAVIGLLDLEFADLKRVIPFFSPLPVWLLDNGVPVSIFSPAMSCVLNCKKSVIDIINGNRMMFTLQFNMSITSQLHRQQSEILVLSP